MDPVTGALISGGLSGFNSGPSGPALSEAYGGSTSVEVGGLSVNKTAWTDLLIAGLIGGAVIWLIK